jgi:hypothetical protein
MKNRRGSRGFLRIFFVFILFGVMNLFAEQSSPGWANIRGADVVRLIGTGGCFGAAIFCLAAYIHGRRFFEDKNSVK